MLHSTWYPIRIHCVMLQGIVDVMYCFGLDPLLVTASCCGDSTRYLILHGNSILYGLWRRSILLSMLRICRSYHMLCCYRSIHSMVWPRDDPPRVLLMLLFSWWCRWWLLSFSNYYLFSFQLYNLLPSRRLDRCCSYFNPSSFVAIVLLLSLSLFFFSCTMRMLLSPFHARGFSIRVGCGTNRAQYLFCDPLLSRKIHLLNTTASYSSLLIAN